MSVRPAAERLAEARGEAANLREHHFYIAANLLDALAAELRRLAGEVEQLQEKLRSAYAYRETMEGLPPGTLTSKVAAAASGTEER